MIGVRARALLTGAMVAIVAGCAAGSTPSSPPAPSDAVSAAVSPSPADASARVMFSGTLDCGFPDGLKEISDGPITTYTGTIECTYVASDPRASGTESGVMTMVELNLPTYHVNKWFSRSDSGLGITNAGGSWRNTEVFGADVWDPTGTPRTTGTAAYLGEGGYAGLRMRLLYAQGSSEPVDGYILVGWIEPAD